MNFWKNVAWFDELKFNLFGSDDEVMVWRTPREESDLKYTIPTIKQGGGSVIVWAYFTCQGVGKLCVLDCIMDRFYYRDILEQNLQSSINHFKLGQRRIFMHNNDSKHTSALIKDWLKREMIQTLSWSQY